MNVFDIIWKYRQGFLHGLGVTCKICLIVWAVGILMGTIIGFWMHKRKIAGAVIKWISNIVTAIPVIVFLFWMHYPMQAMMNIVIDPFVTSVLAFSIVNMLGVANIVKEALTDFPQQYLVAAKTLGLSKKVTIKRIQIPLILRLVLPSLLSLQINMLQMSLFSSFIGVEDIFRMAQRINAVAYKPIEIYTALGLFFIIICLPLNLLVKYLNDKYTRDTSEN